MSRRDAGALLPPAKARIARQIVDALSPISGIASVTFVGSFVDRDDLGGISDLDTVVVFDTLTPERFAAAAGAVGALSGQDLGCPGGDVLVNTTLGPLKHDRPDRAVVHLMMYDRNSHREHVLKSPFTCLDWERSAHGWGESLSAIYPVGRLEPRDFLAARRGLANYVNDLDSGTLSYRRLEPKGDRMVEVADRAALDPRHRGEYACHIVKNSIANALKMRTGQNVLWGDERLRADWLAELPELAAWLPFYERLLTAKRTAAGGWPDDSLIETRRFIEAFSQSLEASIDEADRLRFVRHARTTAAGATFLGQGRDPGVADAAAITAMSGDWDAVRSSPLRRAIETANALAPGAAIRTDARLAEINYGRAEGMTADDCRARFPELAAAWDRGDDPPFPEGESTDNVRARVRSFLDDVPLKAGRGLVVTHNVVMRVVAAELLGLDRRRAYRLPIGHLESLDVCRIGGRWLPDWGATVKARLLDAYVGWVDDA